MDEEQEQEKEPEENKYAAGMEDYGVEDPDKEYVGDDHPDTDYDEG